MNKKKIAESIELYKVRINQLDEELKGQNFSSEQRNTLESEKIIANIELAKLQNPKTL